MSRKLAAYVLVAAVAVPTAAQAGAVITLTQITPTPSGGFLGGETVEFSVAISTSEPIEARLMTLDFADSSAELTFVGPDSNGNLTAEFVWTYQLHLISNAQYAQFPDYPLPNVVYTGISPVAGFILPLTGSATVVGHGAVELPLTPGTYLIDALNADSGNDSGLGARIDFGFPDFMTPTSWRANEEDITGEPLSLTVVPEPATLVLLGLGGLAMLHRRKA